MKILITGCNGFAGSHLADFLLKNVPKAEIFALVRDRLSDLTKIAHLLDHPNFKVCECELTSALAVNNIIEKTRPEFIFHLAAQSFVPKSWIDPEETIKTNVLGIISLLEAVRKHCPEAKIFVCGSAEEYGKVNKNNGPISEDQPLIANNPYGGSKVSQEVMARVWHASYGLQVCLARSFAHEGPRRGKEFATSDFALQAISIKKGFREPIIYYGCLETERDYMHIQEMVKCYWLLMQNFVPGESYNICTGRSTSIGQLACTFLESAGIQPNSVGWYYNGQLSRPTQASFLVGNPNKLAAQIGYVPSSDLPLICRDMLKYWEKNYQELTYWKNK